VRTPPQPGFSPLRQPRGPAKVDPKAGLLAFYMPTGSATSLPDWCGNGPTLVPVSGTIPPIIERLGLTLPATAFGQNWVQSGTLPAIMKTAQGTILWYVDVTGAASGVPLAGIYSHATPGAPPYGACAFAVSGSSLYAEVTTGGTYDVSCIGTYSTGVHMYAMTFGNGVKTQIFDNGKLSATSSVTNAGVTYYSDSTLGLNWGGTVHSGANIGYLAFFPRILSVDEIRYYTANPFAMLLPDILAIPAAAATTSVSLSGAAITASAGAVSTTASDNISITGAAATSAAGSVAPSISASAAIVGSSAATAAGSVGVAISSQAAVVGAAATTAAGAVSESASGNASVTGAAAATNAGIVSVAMSSQAAVAGAAAATAAGVVSAVGGAQASVAGASAAVAAGPVGVSRSAQASVSGAAAASAAGSVSASGAANIAATGASATCAAGAISASAGSQASISGAVAASAAGAISLSTSRGQSVAGASASAFAGVAGLSVGSQIAISGAGVTLLAGTVAFAGARLTGAVIVGRAGSTAAAMRYATSGVILPPRLRGVAMHARRRGVVLPISRGTA